MWERLGQRTVKGKKTCFFENMEVRREEFKKEAVSSIGCQSAEKEKGENPLSVSPGQWGLRPQSQEGSPDRT